MLGLPRLGWCLSIRRQPRIWESSAKVGFFTRWAPGCPRTGWGWGPRGLGSPGGLAVGWACGCGRGSWSR